MKKDKILKAYEKMLEGKVNEEKDAASAYKKSYDSILKNLDKLKSVLKKHSVKQGKNPMDWGYAGDLGYIDDELTDLIKNFK